LGGYHTYNRASDKVDSQAQLRLNMDELKEALSTAVDVSIYDSLPADDDYLYIYIDNDTFVLQDGTGTPEPLPAALAIPGLEVVFTRSNMEERVTHIRIQCDEGSWLASDIFFQNMPGTGAISGDTEGNIIAFKRVD